MFGIDYIKGKKAKQLFLSYLLSKYNNKHTSITTVNDISDLIMQKKLLHIIENNIKQISNELYCLPTVMSLFEWRNIAIDETSIYV